MIRSLLSYVRRRPLLLFSLYAAVLVAVVACQTSINIPTTATGGSVVQNGGGPNGAGTPTPGPGGTLPPGAFVRLGFFGISCPQGTTPPANGLRELPLPCRGFLTATPKYTDGTDIPAAVHGPNCAWEVTSGASVVNLQTTGEAFNRDATCNTAGPWNLKATVLNVSGEAGFSCTGTAARAGFFDLVGGEPLDFERVADRDVYWTSLATPDLKAWARERIHEERGR